MPKVFITKVELTLGLNMKQAVAIGTAHPCQTTTTGELISEVDSTPKSTENPGANRVTATPGQAAMPGKESSRPKSSQRSPPNKHARREPGVFVSSVRRNAG